LESVIIIFPFST